VIASRAGAFILAPALAAALGAAIFWYLRPDLVMEIPAMLLLAMSIAFAVALACGGQWYLHQRFREEDFIRHNEIGGTILATAGTLYAVVLGFLIVATWQEFAQARQLVALESAAAADAWHMAVGLPRAQRSRVRSAILAYSNLMVAGEWPLMRRGTLDTRGDLLIMTAIGAAGTFRPADMSQSNAQSGTLAQLGILHDVRQRRLATNVSEIAPFEWFILLLGGVLVICFCWLFGAPNRIVHLAMTACVATIIASMLVLLFELQYPFRTSLRIGPDDWAAVVQHIRLMQAGNQTEMRM
jgi:Protein of unknown function (DUF4239)